ncbi:MAG TPA: hypothetical protein VH683_00710 [Thermoleophilaceae bacterium]|jgi:hypothetical protein
MLSKFNEVLPVLRDGDVQVGVCAMGPVGDDDTLIWMRVWVWQQDGDSVAAAAGNAGDHVEGAHELDDEDCPPFAHPDKKRWMVQTKLEPESALFTDKKPVLVQAIALVEKNGQRNIVQWSQGVALRIPAGHAHAAGHAHDGHAHN